MESWFGRPFNDWKLRRVEDFIRVIRDRRANLAKEDKMVWKVTKDGSFSVRSNTNILEGGK